MFHFNNFWELSFRHYKDYLDKCHESIAQLDELNLVVMNFEWGTSTSGNFEVGTWKKMNEEGKCYNKALSFTICKATLPFANQQYFRLSIF